VLAALCGFAYGWHERSVNPPFVITRKTEEPPEVKLLRKAAMMKREGSTRFHQGRKERSLQVLQRGGSLRARAVNDPSNREKWLEQAAFYVDKSVRLASDDSLNSMDAAFNMDRIGDISNQSCPYYEKHANTLKTQWAS